MVRCGVRLMRSSGREYFIMAKHISAKRVAMSKELILWKNLKKSFKKVKGLSCGKSSVELFKYCYPNLWEDICRYHDEMTKWNASRKKKNLSVVYGFQYPEQFIESHSHVNADTSIVNGKTQEEIDAIIETIRNQSLAKLNSRETKDSKRERYIQHTQPGYVGLHIKAYYSLRKQHPEDIDARYLIVHELAKYKCDDTIRFLTCLVRCEKNLSLQHFAWEKLNELGVTGVHKGRRKGKKKVTHVKRFVPILTPQDLLKAIYNSPLEQMKHYDLFLSHSYKDKNKLIELKDSLNAMGLNVYMDWVNDKDELLRNLTCAETAKVITERIKASKAIFYVHTNASSNSKWTPWELGFASALNKPILVYRPEETENEPEYLQLYNTVVLEEGQLLIGSEKTDIREWLNDESGYDIKPTR